MQHVWNKGLILQTLRTLYRDGKDISYNRLARKMQPLVSAAAYHFGSYRKAVERAGLDYAEIARKPRWTKPLVIKELKNFAARYGRLKDADLRADNPPLYGAALRFFKTLSAARRAIGK